MAPQIVINEKNEDPPIALALVLVLFGLYILLSVVLTILHGFVNDSLSQPRKPAISGFWVLVLCVAGVFTSQFFGWDRVVDFGNGVLVLLEPFLLRLFGVGGQGFLHLCSLYFVDLAKLSIVDILWRVAAGGYSTILAAMFLIPMVLVFTAYLSPVDDALQRIEGDTRPSSKVVLVEEENRNNEDKVNKRLWECKICFCVNDSATRTCGLCEGHRWDYDDSEHEIDDESIEADASTLGDDEGDDAPVCLDSFDMSDFDVLAHLGEGTTSIVTLARFASRKKTRIDGNTGMDKPNLTTRAFAFSRPCKLDKLGEANPVRDGEWWPGLKWMNKSDMVNDLYNVEEPDAPWIRKSMSSSTLGLSNGGVPSEEVANWVEQLTPPSSPKADESNFNQTGMPELVAIKTMNKRKIVAMGMHKSIEQERRVLGMVNSEFVCRMYGAFQDRVWAYLLLEPVPAGDLASLLDARVVMFESEAMFYVGCVLLALAHLHDRGIASLDIKPENMLLDQYGYLKLCDFGIAKVFDSDTLNGSKDTLWEFTGTPEYMAPEVVQTSPVIPNFLGVAGPDIWAVGVLTFELLVGATPFASQDLDEPDNSREVLSNIKRFTQECASRAQVYKSQSREQFGNAIRSGWKTLRGGGGLRERAKGRNICLESELGILKTTWLKDIRSKTTNLQQLIVELLRPDPTERLGSECVRTFTSGGDVARSVMEHPWFLDATSNDSDWSWDALRARRVIPPFIPDADSLAPPFRGEAVSHDITHEVPLTFAEFQAARDKSSVSSPSAKIPPFVGFVEASRPELLQAQVDKLRPHAIHLMQVCDNHNNSKASNIEHEESLFF